MKMKNQNHLRHMHLLREHLLMQYESQHYHRHYAYQQHLQPNHNVIGPLLTLPWMTRMTINPLFRIRIHLENGKYQMPASATTRYGRKDGLIRLAFSPHLVPLCLDFNDQCWVPIHHHHDIRPLQITHFHPLLRFRHTTGVLAEQAVIAHCSSRRSVQLFLLVSRQHPITMDGRNLIWLCGF